MKKRKGLFITFEGIEGSGKSTHCRLATDYVRAQGRTVLALREPGGTAVGERVRAILLDKKHTAMTVEAELLLYNAARVQLVHEQILPALRRGAIVLCDRFFDSTLAYQCFAGKLQRSVAQAVIDVATGGLVPTKTFLLDSDVRRGLRRAGRGDRMERKPIAFHERVRKGFLSLARQFPKRFVVIKECPIDEGRRRIERCLDELIA